MASEPIRRALISVSDKAGVVDFARTLAGLGVELISTGGTARTLREAGLEVADVSSVTGADEILGGRVKTLHPAIHGGILADLTSDTHREQLAERDIEPIGLVCVNLYPFEATVARNAERAEAIENIDIGGPAMIRAAAKNADRVAVVTSPLQYEDVIGAMRTHEGCVPDELRKQLQAAAFARTAAYDTAIAAYLSDDREQLPEQLLITGKRAATLRYGENPHQAAALYATGAEVTGVVGAEQLHGKALSYNNLLDTNAAVRACRDAARAAGDQAAAVIVKHTNPCGFAAASKTADAVELAIAGDPLAAFGGIAAVSRSIDQAAAELLAAADRFFEVIAAPGFDADALETLRNRWANVRLLRVPELDPACEVDAGVEIRTLMGGVLAQSADNAIPNPASWEHHAGPKLDAADLRAAGILEICARSVTSNAVVIGGLANGD
ncbi:MAG: bifunctional phosphoribosylaminoimidazolecarboxamide formyltransferase/IMP cyclohydrolase, partial [Planctomycetota bacterium]